MSSGHFGIWIAVVSGTLLSHSLSLSNGILATVGSPGRRASGGMHASMLLGNYSSHSRAGISHWQAFSHGHRAGRRTRSTHATIAAYAITRRSRRRTPPTGHSSSTSAASSARRCCAALMAAWHSFALKLSRAVGLCRVGRLGQDAALRAHDQFRRGVIWT